MTMDVTFDKVSVRFGGFTALNDLSFTLQGGKIHGLLGRNGAGKSTLLALLASFMEPTSGRISVGGASPFENAPVMEQVTMVFDADYRNETETVKGMLEAAERYRPNYDAEFAAKLVELFGLPLKKQIRHLSRGKQAAFNVTLGLASRSPLTIYDEAYLGMDAPTRDIFYRELMEDQSANPRTIIFSTHYVSEMDYLFDEVLIIDQGGLVVQEPYDTLVSKGVTITGAASVVDEFTQDLKLLGTQQLGGTKSVTVYGELTDSQRLNAKRQGLEIGPVSLQDLFIHLTNEGGSR